MLNSNTPATSQRVPLNFATWTFSVNTQNVFGPEIRRGYDTGFGLPMESLQFCCQVCVLSCGVLVSVRFLHRKAGVRCPTFLVVFFLYFKFALIETRKRTVRWKSKRPNPQNLLCSVQLSKTPTVLLKCCQRPGRYNADSGWVANDVDLLQDHQTASGCFGVQIWRICSVSP